MEERIWVKHKGRMVPKDEIQEGKHKPPVYRRIPDNTVWNSTRNGPYVKKKHGPLPGKDKENYDKAVQEIIEKVESGKISDKKY